MNPIGFNELFGGDLKQGLADIKTAIEAINKVLAETKTEADAFGKKMGEDLKNRINQTTTSTSNLDAEMKKLRTDTEQFKQTISQTNNTLNQYKKVNEDLKEKVKKLEEETRKYEKTQKETNKTVASSGVSLKGLSQQLLGVASGAALVYKGVTMLKEQISEAVKSSIEFSASMKEVQAISRASAEGLQLLTKDAQRLGATTEKTALQVSATQKELAKLGFTITEILASTSGIIDLSTATGEGLAESARVAAATLRAFGLDAEEMTRVVDVMAGSFVRSGLDLEKFRESMKLVAPIARSANIDIETTTAALSKLADAGLSGSLAGTALRNLMSNMAQESGKLGQRLGFAVQNSDDLIRAFKQLSAEGITLSEVVDLVDVRARPAFFTLLNQIDAVESLALEYSVLDGEANNIAETMRDELKNDIEIATSAFDAMRREMVDGLLPAMREGVQDTTTFVEALRLFTKGMKDGTAQQETFVGGMLKALGTIKDTVMYVTMLDRAAEGFQYTWDSLTGNIEDYVESGKLNENIEDTITTLESAFNSIENANVAFDAHREATKLLKEGYEDTDESLQRLKESYPDLVEAIEKKNKGIFDSEKFLKVLIGRQEELFKQTKSTVEGLEATEKSLVDLVAELKEAGDQTGRLESAERLLAVTRGILGTQTQLLTDIEEELNKKKKEGAELTEENARKLEAARKKEEQERKRLAQEAERARREAEKAALAKLKLETDFQMAMLESAKVALESNKKIQEAEKDRARVLLTNVELHHLQKQMAKVALESELANIEISVKSTDEKIKRQEIAYEKYYQTLMKLETDLKLHRMAANEATLKDVKKTVDAKFKENMKLLKNDPNIKAFEERRKERQKDAKDEAVLENQRAMLLAQSIAAARRGFDTFFDYRKSKRDAEIAEITRWEEERVRLAGDNEEAITAIREQADQKRREIKNKNARDEKAQAMFNIALNTAQAIVAALKLPIGGIPLSIAIGAIGAAQLAMVAAKPVPQFAKGTDNAPEGHAIVGEKGHELVWDKKSNNISITPDKPTLTYLSKGSVVIPNSETERMLSAKVDRNEVAYDRINAFGSESKKDSQNLMKLGGMFKDAVREIPLHQTTFDAKGVREFVKKGNNRTERLNRRYGY